MYRRKFSRPVRRYRRKLSKKPSKGVRSYVKRAIHRNIENKRANQYGTVSVFCPNSGGASCQNVNILPTPGQGTAEGQRVGDKIRLMSGKLHFSATYKAYNATSNPYTKYFITIAVVQTLQHNDANPNATDYNYFFDTGTSTVPFQCTALDTMLRLNENRFKVFYKRTFLMGSNTFGATNNQSLGNAFKECIRGNFRIPMKKLRKICKFDDASTTTSMSNNLSLLAWASPSDDTASGSSTIIPMALTYNAEWQYEDA